MAAPRTIFLVRHGETEWNLIGRWQGTTDIPLSDTGRAQARALGIRMRGHGIVRVYTSHLSRARETAEIVAALLGSNLQVVVDARLRERGYGCFEGLTRDECAARYPGVWEQYEADRRHVPPDAEPQTEIVARVTAVMHEIATATDPAVPDAQDDAPILVVSHGGAIRSFVLATSGILLPPLHNGAVLPVAFDGERFRLADEIQAKP